MILVDFHICISVPSAASLFLKSYTLQNVYGLVKVKYDNVQYKLS